MPFMKPDGTRDYEKMKNWEKQHKGGKIVKDRAKRNQARVEMGLKVGDGKHVDHVKPLSEGGSDKKSNMKVVTAKANLAKEAARKKKKAK